VLHLLTQLLNLVLALRKLLALLG